MSSLNEVVNSLKTRDDLSLEYLFLNCHHDVTRLWLTACKNKADIEKRTANLLISVLLLANKLNIADIDDLLTSRVAEIQAERSS